MLEPKDTITLSLGRRSLTVVRLRGRFIGLIDGTYYVDAESAHVAAGALIRTALGRLDRTEMRKRPTTDSAELVRAARKAAGDGAQDAGMTDAESAAIEEMRRDLPRPENSEIKKMARRLARPN